MNECISRLSSALFWDVDRNTVDVRKNERWLVERVLQRGTWEDWLVIREVYGKSRLRQLMPALLLDPKSANFLRLYCSL
ncbi:MAG: hypothetical protein ABIJ86_11505 [Spirochaetota bacterium]